MEKMEKLVNDFKALSNEEKFAFVLLKGYRKYLNDKRPLL